MINGTKHNLAFSLCGFFTQQNNVVGLIPPYSHVPCTSKEKKICLKTGEGTLKYM